MPEHNGIDFESVREVALRFIDYQPRTRAEVLARLARAGVDEDLAEAVTADLERAGILNDARFSADWVESRARRKGFGRRRLEAELRRKGIAAPAVEGALEQFTPEAELEAALALARKRATAKSLAEPAEKRRLAAWLQRRGYKWEVIEQVFREILANTQ